MTLEGALQRLADLRAAERAVAWEIADTVASAVPTPTPRGSLGVFAEVLGCSARWVSDLVRVSRTFVPDHRLPDVPFGLYVVAARSNDPLKWIEVALGEGWSTADLQRGIRGEPKAEGACPSCGRPLPKKRAG